MPHTEHGLDEPGDTGRRLQMTQIRLHRTQHQRRGPVTLTENRTQRVQLDRITQRRPRAVGLDVIDIGRTQPRRRQRRPQHRLLRRTIGHRLPATGTVLVDRRTPHHRQHRIPIAQRITEPLEHHHPGTLAAHIPVRIGVKSLATPVRRQHPPPRTRDAVLRTQNQIHPGSQRLIALPATQTLTRQMHRHQRRRTRRVHHHRRTVHPQEIRQPPRSEIRRIPEGDIRVDILRPRLCWECEIVIVTRCGADEDRGLRPADRLGR